MLVYQWLEKEHSHTTEINMITNEERQQFINEGRFLPNWIHNDRPFKSDTAILVTSWMGHLKWLKYTLNSYKQTGKFLIYALDTHLRFDDIKTYDNHLPPMDILAIPDVVVMKHSTWEADKRNGWLWNIIYGESILSQFDNFKYVFTINSDCCIDRPEGLDELIQELGDYDFMPQSVEYDGEDKEQVKLIHTCSVLYKVETFKKFVEYFKENLKNNIPDSYSPESLMVEAQNKYKFKMKEVDSPKFPDFLLDFAGQIDHYASYHEDSTWKKVLGYRNLCAENDTGGIERLPPLDKKYFDLRNDGMYLPGYERETLYQFFKTGDWRYVWMLWDQDEDSWYDRRVYPIEHYGDAPVYNVEQK
jgi:hypothetical protein